MLMINQPSIEGIHVGMTLYIAKLVIFCGHENFVSKIQLQTFYEISDVGLMNKSKFVLNIEDRFSQIGKGKGHF